MKLDLHTANENRIKELANRSAFTWEGMDLSDGNLDEIARVFCDQKLVKPGKEKIDAYTWSGAVMNALYGLTGENAYPDDLPFLSIDNDSFDGEGNLNVFKMSIGARWLDDIVRNNALNEQEQQD